MTVIQLILKYGCSLKHVTTFIVTPSASEVHRINMCNLVNFGHSSHVSSISSFLLCYHHAVQVCECC